MPIKKRGFFAITVAAAVVVTTVVALPANSQGPKSDSDIVASVAAAFPYVKQVAAHAPITRLAVDDPQVVAEGATGPDGALTLQATRGGNVCAVYNGTSTCAPIDKAASSGLFIGEISCSGPKAGTARVVGAAPRGVTTVTSDAGRQTTAADGFVSFAAPGGKLRGLSLDNGKVASLVLDADLCNHRSIVNAAG